MSGHFVAMTVNCESWRGGMGLCCCRGDEQIKADEPIVMTSFRSFDCAFESFWSFFGEIVWKRAILNCTFLCIVYVMTSQGRLAIRRTFP